MINLQLKSDETLSDVEGDSIDVDDGSDSLWHSSHGKMTHIEETTKMDFSDLTDTDIVLQNEHSFAVSSIFTHSDHGWDGVELSGAMAVEDDTFLQNLLASGAYQSHLHDNNLGTRTLGSTLGSTGVSRTLGGFIRDAMANSVFNREQKFLPEGAVDGLVTRDFIIWAFYKSKNHPSLTSSLQSVISFILTKTKKIFAIFVLIGLKGAALYQLMVFLFERRIYDDRLPFENSKLEEFHPSLEFEDDTKGMRVEQEDSGNETWTDDHVSDFFDQQWRFCSPTFSTSKENHDIDMQAILPFTEKHADSTAEGVFGEVMKCKIHESHLDTSGLIFPCTEYVAIKKIKVESHQGREFKISAWEKVVKTLWTMRALGERHIVNFITAFRLGEDEHYLILEWADDGNLRNLWEQFPRRLTAELVKDVFGQLLGLARALCKIHNPVDGDISDQYFRHGNLKPENILRFKDANDSAKLGTLKIGDWAVTKQHNSMTPLRTVTPPHFFGTRRYEPPEEGSIRHSKLFVSASTGKLDRRQTRLNDIWAMGCIWLEFLIWLMYGYEELKRFNRSLDQEYTGTPSFYEIGEDGNAKVHHVALQWMEHMAQDPVCEVGQTALGNLLEIIRDRLLVVKLPQKNFDPIFDLSRSPRLRRRSSHLSYASTDDSPPRGRVSLASLPQVTVAEPDSLEGSAQENPPFSYALSQSNKNSRVRAKGLWDMMDIITSDVDIADYWLSGTPRPPPRSIVSDTQEQSSNNIETGFEAELFQDLN
ncbi:hypothetical protein NW752_002390 [Fusarium irregulare]|uniref:Protein kinase domain-containing protein n=1 Tax=Fusarium irregulare TaxID=2494466 RepID=A0A9W8PGT0_9HYPO|nr:hypothetical protein NW766_011107 [Fusarium irregulare]KAJ4024936.1 hypothetical protein NW752_002390 [Fusarium irregulare]